MSNKSLISLSQFNEELTNLYQNIRRIDLTNLINTIKEENRKNVSLWSICGLISLVLMIIAPIKYVSFFLLAVGFVEYFSDWELSEDEEIRIRQVSEILNPVKYLIGAYSIIAIVFYMPINRHSEAVLNIIAGGALLLRNVERLWVVIESKSQQFMN